MKPVVFNPVAVDDLDEIISHIAEDNAVAAVEVLRVIHGARHLPPLFE